MIPVIRKQSQGLENRNKSLKKLFGIPRTTKETKKQKNKKTKNKKQKNKKRKIRK